MQPTVKDNGTEPWMMEGIAVEPLIIRGANINGTTLMWAEGFERITASSPQELEERWRTIAADPFAYVDASMAATEEDLKVAQENEAEEGEGASEGDLEACEEDLYRMRVFWVLMRMAWDLALAQVAEKVRAKRDALAERARSPLVSKEWCEAEGRGLDFALQMLAISDAPALPFPR